MAKVTMIEELEAKLRKSALQELSALGQAMEAYQSQLAAEAKLERAVEALGGMIDLFSADNVLRKGTHLNMEISNARTTLAELKGITDE